MNKRIIIHTVGLILLIEAVLMMAPMVVSIIYGEAESRDAFFLSAIATAIVGRLMVHQKPKKSRIYAREGFTIVALAWILMSFMGCLPFVISGSIPNFVDAFFETVSGFTTTGSSILTDVESLGYGMLFWRSFTHWVGGMGVLVFVMLILPLGGSRNIYILRAESPGPSAGKLVPKMKETAKILYGIYLAMTVILVLFLLAGGMDFYDCLINAFGTAGTGGFSNWSDGIAHYHSEYLEVVIGIFMILFGINFNLYYMILIKKAKAAFKSEELHYYLGIIAFAVITIALNIRGLCGDFHEALREAFFQVASIITTTGFSTVNFVEWPQYSKMILVVLMIFGACAGSTGGGLKISRVILYLRMARRGLRRLNHPRSVEVVRFQGKVMDENTLHNCNIYLVIYCIIILVSTVVVSLDNFSFETTVTAVLTCFNNIGPGLGEIGPYGTFGHFSYLTKLVLCFDMLAGRLEIFPLLLMFAPSLWTSFPRPIRRASRERELRESDLPM